MNNIDHGFKKGFHCMVHAVHINPTLYQYTVQVWLRPIAYIHTHICIYQ